MMFEKIKSGWLFYLFFVSAFVLVPQGLAVAETADLKSSTKPEIGVSKSVNGEQLLFREVTLTSPVWCGNSNLVLDGENGPVILDLYSGYKRKVANSPYIGATSCSPDGKWLLLADVRTGSPRFLRFNLVTGKTEPIAYGYLGQWSPDGAKVLFLASSQSNKLIKYPDPQWEFYWAHEWPVDSHGKAAWLADSQGLILGHKGAFYLQHEQNITPLKLSLRPNLGNSILDIYEMSVDEQGSIYTKARIIDPSNKNSAKDSLRRLFKCTLDRDQIDCDGVTGATEDVLGFDVSRDGKKLIYADANKCLNQVSFSVGEMRCIARDVSGVVSISPDAKRVAFSRFREKGKSGVFTADAYIIQLK